MIIAIGTVALAVPLLLASPAAATGKPDPCPGEHVPVYNHGNNVNGMYVCGPIQGEPGKDGEDGVDGKDGKDGGLGLPGLPGSEGKDGEDGAPGKPGAPGKDGADGRDGTDGSDGAKGDRGQEGLADGAGDGALPDTGNNNLGLALVGLGLLVAGTSVVVYRRRQSA